MHICQEKSVKCTIKVSPCDKNMELVSISEMLYKILNNNFSVEQNEERISKAKLRSGIY